MIKNFVQQSKELGLLNSLYDFYYRGMNKLTFFKVLQGMIVKLEYLEPTYLETNDRFTFKMLKAQDLSHFADNKSLQLSSTFLELAKKKDDYCMAVFDGNTLASYGWYSNQPTNINDELMLNFKNTYVYMYKGFTAPEYRGMRLHALGMARALQEFTQIGFEGLISYVEKNNFSSLKSCYRMGYKNIGKLLIAKIPGTYMFLKDKECHQYDFSVQTAVS